MAADLSTVNAVKEAVFAPDVVKTQGAGKAYQSVAQSMAIAVQDVTDHMRNISTIATTAVAVTTELMIANPDKFEQYSKIMDKAQGTVDQAAESFEKIVQEAGKGLKDFPSGSDS